MTRTELNMIKSARTGYRALFTAMATTARRYHIYATESGVLIADEALKLDNPVLVQNVQAMAEETMVNALSLALRR